MTEQPGAQLGSRKSEDAYRTISEVAAELDLPQHVLRFWETRFPQVKPLKRAGGRRFYRPEDVALLRAVRVLLYDEGYTIKGVQRLLAEHGARHVADALARSRAVAPPADQGSEQGRDQGRDRGSAMPKQDHAARHEPTLGAPEPAAATPAGRPQAAPPPVAQRAAPTPPAAAAPPAHAPAPVASVPRAVAVPGSGASDMVGRLSSVLAELGECARLLASVRST